MTTAKIWLHCDLWADLTLNDALDVIIYVHFCLLPGVLSMCK